MPQPNFIVVFPDQWRGDCLSCAGHPTVRTPFLDHIAEQGVRFDAAYSAAPTCIPARACLATGMTPSSHNRLGYKDGVPWEYPNTMMRVLRDGGYQTMQSGKTHFYPQRASLGFEENRLYEIPIHDRGFESDYHLWLRRQTGGRIEDIAHQADPNTWAVKTWDYDEDLHCTNWIVDNAMEMLVRRDPTRPFFLQIGIHRPHAPYDPPRAYYERYADVELPPVPVGDWCADGDHRTLNLNCWRGRIPADALDRARRAYYANIEHIDYQIGKLFNFLGKHRLLADTFLLFLSDHGEQLGDHHYLRKATPFEGSAKIPFIMRVPSRFGGRGVCSAPVTHMDIMPTFLEAAGIPIPAGVEGASLLPLLAGPASSDGAASVPWREYVHGEHANGDHGWQYLTDGKIKYVWETKSGRELLFDLSVDPQELRDLSSSPAYAERLLALRARLAALLGERPADGLSDGVRLIPGRVLPDVRQP